MTNEHIKSLIAYEEKDGGTPKNEISQNRY